MVTRINTQFSEWGQLLSRGPQESVTNSADHIWINERELSNTLQAEISHCTKCQSIRKTGEIQCHWVESNKSAIQTHTEAVDASVPERSQ